jgi:hypothetical protein
MSGAELRGPRRPGLAPPPEGGAAAVESYLAEVSARFPGPVRAQAGIVAELRSGLLDATDAYCCAGLPDEQAALAATGEFGDPGLVADSFRTEIAARQARRVSVSLAAAGPLVGCCGSPPPSPATSASNWLRTGRRQTCRRSCARAAT